MNKRSRLSLITAATLVLLLVAAIGAWGPKRGHELQRYKASLQARGEKLTLREWPFALSTNGEALIARLTNAIVVLNTARYQPGALDLGRNVRAGVVEVTWKTNPIPITMYRQVPRSWESMGAEIEELAEPLADLREVARMPPRGWGPRSNVFSGSIPNFVAVRSAAQWMAASALWNVRQAKLDLALNDLEALVGISQINRDELTLVAQMIRIAVASLALKATWDALQAEGWTDAQLERMQKMWQSIDLLQVLETGLVAERVFGGEIWYVAREPKGRQKMWSIMFSPNTRSAATEPNLERLFADYVWFPAYKLTAIDDDELFHLRLMQEGVDAVRQLRANRAWVQVKKEVDELVDRIDQKAKSIVRYRYWLSLLATPNFSKAVSNAARAEAERRMTLVAIGLQRYTLARKPPPASLEALVPDFLPAVPNDPMSGKSLRYQLKGDGTWVLYSVGEDGHDDGGDPSPSPQGSHGLWEGHDAVWPSPAQ